MRHFKSIQEIKESLPEHNNWFDSETMLFWGTEVDSEVMYGEYFFTRDYTSNPLSRKRRWSIRKIHLYENGEYGIKTVGKFNSYTSKAKAKKALEEILCDSL